MSNSVSTIDKAVSFHGSQTNLANKLGVPQQTVNWWVKKQKIPPGRALAVALSTNNTITVEQILTDNMNRG
jgi:DNA-binding transcriptional regulator YdaS (Cro superfamily)|tara:strand:- start:37 stop:249 length:213 start_codon:yes stop_codon:yes gene_type:complete